MKQMSRKGFSAIVFLCFLTSMSYAQENYEETYKLNNARISGTSALINDKISQLPTDFTRMLDKNKEAIADASIPMTQKIEDQQLLIQFLEKATSPELINNGRYTSMLRYNLFLIQWRQQNQLYQNVIQYPLLSVRSLRLFAQDTAAYLLLDSIATQYPEEILRNSDAFIDKWYAARIIVKISAVAPESIKRYFTSTSKIKDILLSDKSAEIQALREIYYKLPLKTKAYFLFDPIFKRRIEILRADSITAAKDKFFSNTTNILNEPHPFGLYSINKELDFIAVDIARGLSLKSDIAIVNYYQITEYSKEQIVTVLVFGYSELFPMDFENLLSILQRKGTYPISSYFFENLPKQKVAEFVRYLQQEDKLDRFIKIAGENNKPFLQSLFSYEKQNDDLTPDMKDIPVPVVKEQPPVWKEDVAYGQKKEDMNAALAKIEREIKAKKEEEAKKIAEPEELIEPVQFNFTEDQKKVLVLKQNIVKSLQNIGAFINEPYAKEILLYAADVEPDELFKKVDQFKTKFFLQEVLERAALQAPVSAKRYLMNPYHTISFFLSKSENPYIKKMVEINAATGFKTKPYLLINELTDNRISVENAMAICDNQDRLFKELVKIVAKKNYVGKYSIEKEFSYYALRFIRDINDKIAQPENIRFSTLDNLTNDELYFATVYGREEVFNTTFSGIFARYEQTIARMSDQGFRRFLELPKFRTFIALCATNDKLTKLLTYFSLPQREALLKQFVSHLEEEESSFEEAVMVSETIANTTNESILEPLERNLKLQYKSCDSLKQSKCMAIYGILAGLCKDKAVIDQKWFKAMSKRYQAAELTTLRCTALNENDLIVERMYFYDDPDGRDSYQSFLASFRNSFGWRLDEYFSYVRVISTSGKHVEIYANKPSYEESGEQNIKKIFSENSYVPSIIVHRGHSFHTEKTLEKIPSTTKLVFIGSCGGFYKASIAIKNAPDAQIIATRQIGTKQINDPIIFSINESLRQGQDLQWPVFWDKMKTNLGNYSLFYDYVPPHKNIESLFQRAYYKTLGL